VPLRKLIGLSYSKWSENAPKHLLAPKNEQIGERAVSYPDPPSGEEEISLSTPHPLIASPSTLWGKTQPAKYHFFIQCDMIA